MEALFSELKNLVGLRRLRLRRIKFVRQQFYLAAVAQNLKRWAPVTPTLNRSLLDIFANCVPILNQPDSADYMPHRLFGRSKRERLHCKGLEARHVNLQIEVALTLGLIFHVTSRANGNSHLGFRKL